RRAVLAQQVRDRPQLVVRDPDREALVDPEARVQDSRAQEERDRRQRGEQRGRRPTRRLELVEAHRARPLRYRPDHGNPFGSGSSDAWSPRRAKKRSAGAPAPPAPSSERGSSKTKPDLITEPSGRSWNLPLRP